MVPQAWLIQISTLPSYSVNPPSSLTSPSLQLLCMTVTAAGNMYKLVCSSQKDVTNQWKERKWTFAAVVYTTGYTLTHYRGILSVVTRVSFNPIVRTLPHTLLTASTVQVIDVNRFRTFSVASSGSNGPWIKDFGIILSNITGIFGSCRIMLWSDGNSSYKIMAAASRVRDYTIHAKLHPSTY